MDYTVHGILQARILEQLPFPSPGDPLNPGSEPGSPALQADSLLSELPDIQGGSTQNHRRPFSPPFRLTFSYPTLSKASPSAKVLLTQHVLRPQPSNVTISPSSLSQLFRTVAT